MLTFNVKKIWFDKIMSGAKTHEYREVKDYWTDIFINNFFPKPKSKEEKEGLKNTFLDLLGNDYQLTLKAKICFMNGMIPEENKPRIYAQMKSIKIIDGSKTDLKINKKVYDIEFELPEESEEQ